MKSMSCKQLGGACNEKFRGNSFEEIAELSKKHGREMFQKGEKEHLEAMTKMQEIMQSSKVMQEWYENKKNLFKELPEEEEL